MIGWDWDGEYDERGDRPATEAEAHLEWHRNTGVPVGTPGCPQDACHNDEDYEPPEDEPGGHGPEHFNAHNGDFEPPPREEGEDGE